MKQVFFLLMSIFCLQTSFAQNKQVLGSDSGLEIVSKDSAQLFIKRYGESVAEKSPKEIVCRIPAYWDIDRESLNSILQTDAKTIRVFIGLKTKVKGEQDVPDLFLVGVNEGKEQTDKIVNLIHPCPSACEKSSVLINSYIEGLCKKDVEKPVECPLCDQ